MDKCFQASGFWTSVFERPDFFGHPLLWIICNCPCKLVNETFSVPFNSVWVVVYSVQINIFLERLMWAMWAGSKIEKKYVFNLEIDFYLLSNLSKLSCHSTNSIFDQKRGDHFGQRTKREFILAPFPLFLIFYNFVIFCLVSFFSSSEGKKHSFLSSLKCKQIANIWLAETSPNATHVRFWSISKFCVLVMTILRGHS